MAEPYFGELSQMVGQLELRLNSEVVLEAKHFFSGAALYANGKSCALFSPMGFALKLPTETRQRLIQEGKGAEFRFFAEGPIKKDYVTLSESILKENEALGELMGQSVNYVSQQA